jgi:hypothetical protein
MGWKACEAKGVGTIKDTGKIGTKGKGGDCRGEAADTTAEGKDEGKEAAS